jgi:chaperone modulatory protein CbpM
MITLAILLKQFPGISGGDIQGFLENAWIHADFIGNEPHFRDIDIARLHLIQELRTELAVNDEAVPIILSLLDQLHDTRRRLRELAAAVHDALPATAHQMLAAHLKNTY